ncbi:hypothetical protein E2C01_070065 [Portunus trituberculatus]|uniref:Uncharacterized protein n=1 Tax=Portunus trituberculatus TaxID=210409 RepID=A0A5B7HWB5_PORTR|nr:hypothetical protein [Portunus trituberculatus]
MKHNLWQSSFQGKFLCMGLSHKKEVLTRHGADPNGTCEVGWWLGKVLCMGLSHEKGVLTRHGADPSGTCEVGWWLVRGRGCWS